LVSEGEGGEGFYIARSGRCTGLLVILGGSLRGKLRCVNRAAKERYHYNPRCSPVKRKPTNTAELRIDLAYLSSDLKYSNALSLRLRAACVSHWLYPTDEFDAPSVRKDTQPETARVQPPQGVPTFYLANVEPAQLDAHVCALGLGSKCGCPNAAVGQGS